MDFHFTGDEIRINSKSPEETISIGKMIGKHCSPGDVIALMGELGSGKTTFAKGIALGIGIKDESIVSSPSFTLINEFPGPLPFYHMDFYRIHNQEEAEELGIREYIYGDGIVAIEWPERVIYMLGDGYLLSLLKIKGKMERQISISSVGERSKPLFESLRKELEKN